MKQGVGSHSWHKRKRSGSLRPWLLGVRIPEILNELADVAPFIYLCCKMSVVKQSWAARPEAPKAVIFKDKSSLKLCDGQFLIDLSLNEVSQSLIVCGNKFRSREACYFIVFLNEYSFTCDSGYFAANASEIKIIRETHCLGQGISSIPDIMTCRNELLAQSSPLSDMGDCSCAEDKDDSVDLDNQCSCPNDFNRWMSENEGDNPVSGFEVTQVRACSTAIRWVPTQNASGELPSEIVDISQDASRTQTALMSLPNASTNRSILPPSGIELLNKGVTQPECHVSQSESLHCIAPIIGVPLFSEDVFSNTPSSTHEALLENLSTAPDVTPSAERSSLLYWLSKQDPSVTVCFLEETVRAIDDLQGITPSQPFSEHFNNFAFSV